MCDKCNNDQTAQMRTKALNGSTHAKCSTIIIGSSGILRCENYVRFTPESGHVQCTSPCPLWDNSEQPKPASCRRSGSRDVGASWSYPMVRVFPTRLNCFPMCAEKADDAALTLPISPPLWKSWAPCRVMFSGGF